MYKDFWIPISLDKSNENALQGVIGSPGTAEGRVRIIHPDDVLSSEFDDGDILVCLMTSPDYVPLMKRAGAILTQEGGILSHAAIVSREMEVPCIVGVSDLLDKLKEGNIIEIDANKGVVKILKKVKK